MAFLQDFLEQNFLVDLLKVINEQLTKKLSDKISGPRILAVSNDSPGEFAKLIKTFIDNNENIELKSLAYKGEELDVSEIKKLASLPTYDEAIAMLMSVMQAPLQKLMATMNAVPTKIVRTLDAIKQSKD